MSAIFGSVILATENAVDALKNTSSRTVDTYVPASGSTIMFGRAVRALPATTFVAHRYCSNWSEVFAALMVPSLLPAKADLTIESFGLESAALVNASATLNGLCVHTVYNFWGS